MSYGSIEPGSFGSRNPFGGPTRQGYQPVATQVSPSELQDVFQETSSNIFQINANVVTLEKNLPSLGTSRDTAELRQSLHSTQQQTNKLITSTSQLVKQLTDIISGSSRQDRLRLTRLKTELSDSLQQYGDLQKKIADRSRALLPPAQKDRKQSLQTPFSELVEEGPLFVAGEGIEGDGQAFLSEISEEDVEILRQREEALLQIEAGEDDEGCTGEVEGDVGDLDFGVATEKRDWPPGPHENKDKYLKGLKCSHTMLMLLH
ncbi:t-SNARE domain-containing protein 1-like [Carassius auratus]|uniref:t-SNARE domain-containing protein 1-like n=1 Tax=Carassius auratus TaxID=7957 RepID=A0A6P6LK06_CARAU|nr:t-SNARE domain-containing protein 1-like [Carassius auratus]